MTLVSTSIQIRADSQKLATSDSAVLPSLAQLEESQVKGYILANQLMGDPPTDKPKLQQLKAAFQADLVRNQMIQALANGGGGSGSSSTSSPPSTQTAQTVSEPILIISVQGNIILKLLGVSWRTTGNLWTACPTRASYIALFGGGLLQPCLRAVVRCERSQPNAVLPPKARYRLQPFRPKSEDDV
ncbi:hypothetical protein NA57DRAFT_51442 [Rhizodiscina lignyota]|uniref:Uncharacterized protein n=1 Tax=Rhizodiscina lignyota TaxID=1504668 RepID=A0A9P4IP00_9PEZI|nr:hypothetical protein NA57DRAFT_51442 [Rhizodiscina lignyota]